MRHHEHAPRSPLQVTWGVAPTMVQPKLKIGAPSDRFEREADQVAAAVMRMPEGAPPIQRKCAACTSEDEVRRAPMEEEGDEEELRAKAQPGRTPAVGPAQAAQVTGLTGGRPLSGAERSFFEPRLGHDFSGVRVHSDAQAARAADAIRAQAFTRGHRIVLGARASGGGPKAREVMAHELTHVIQQGQARRRAAAARSDEALA